MKNEVYWKLVFVIWMELLLLVDDVYFYCFLYVICFWFLVCFICCVVFFFFCYGVKFRLYFLVCCDFLLVWWLELCIIICRIVVLIFVLGWFELLYCWKWSVSWEDWWRWCLLVSWELGFCVCVCLFFFVFFNFYFLLSLEVKCVRIEWIVYFE